MKTNLTKMYKDNIKCNTSMHFNVIHVLRLVKQKVKYESTDFLGSWTFIVGK